LISLATNQRITWLPFYAGKHLFERLHTTNGDQPPINYENSLKKCPV